MYGRAAVAGHRQTRRHRKRKMSVGMHFVQRSHSNVWNSVVEEGKGHFCLGVRLRGKTNKNNCCERELKTSQSGRGAG